MAIVFAQKEQLWYGAPDGSSGWVPRNYGPPSTYYCPSTLPLLEHTVRVNPGVGRVGEVVVEVRDETVVLSYTYNRKGAVSVGSRSVIGPGEFALLTYGGPETIFAMFEPRLGSTGRTRLAVIFGSAEGVPDIKSMERRLATKVGKIDRDRG